MRPKIAQDRGQLLERRARARLLPPVDGDEVERDAVSREADRRLSDYFRRYPYDEWYPFDKAEFAAYLEVNPGTPPFPWQK